VDIGSNSLCMIEQFCCSAIEVLENHKIGPNFDTITAVSNSLCMIEQFCCSAIEVLENHKIGPNFDTITAVYKGCLCKVIGACLVPTLCTHLRSSSIRKHLKAEKLHITFPVLV
jgi:hypothetical protein